MATTYEHNYRGIIGKMGKRIAGIIKYAVLLFLVILSLGPVIWVILGSFKTHRELFSNSALSLPSHFDLTNYQMALQLAPIGQFFVNSLLVCLINTGLCIIIIPACAYAIARFEFKMKKLLILLISAVLLLPSQSISQPIFEIYRKIHLFDTKTGLILMYLALDIPFAFYIMRSYFMSIPKSLEESAYIDGAGPLRTYTQIILPLARPGLMTAGILQFIFSWNEFYFAIMLTSGNNARTVPIALNYYTSQFLSNYPAMFAAVTLTILPSIILFIFSQEQVVASLTAGSVKA